MTLLEQQPHLPQIAKGIATLFGINCEVTVHDLTAGYENTIVVIENGHITDRHIGDDASEIVLQAIKSKDAALENRYAYITRTQKGRIIKSSSVFIKDQDGVLVGLFGINYDITDLIMAQNAIEATVSVQEPEDELSIETIATNVTDLLNQLIVEADRHINKPVAMMSKEDKTKAIQYLNDKGAFLVKKAGDKICKHYDISKYTLYNYMGEES